MLMMITDWRRLTFLRTVQSLKWHNFFYYTIPVLAIVIIASTLGLFHINSRIINRTYLWDVVGKPYIHFLTDLNLPRSLGAILIARDRETLSIEPVEKQYHRYNTGDIFTNQLRSLLFNTNITPSSMSFYLNGVFVSSGILLSLLLGYGVFRNGYMGVLVFALIALLRQSCQGLIYGLPMRGTYAVFNPLLAFSIIAAISMFLERRRTFFPWACCFFVCGFILAYTEHCRTSEKLILSTSIYLFIGVMVIALMKCDNARRRILLSVVILLLSINVGHVSYRGMLTLFEKHRDTKIQFASNSGTYMTAQGPFHNLFISLFRFPNHSDNVYDDLTGYREVYNRFPDLEKKYSSRNNYLDLITSVEYHDAVRQLYFEFVLDRPFDYVVYLMKSIWDYVLFLPYFSWTGDKSANVYLPQINEKAEIRDQDLAPAFKHLPEKWLLNLKLDYLPQDMPFWIYFIVSYGLLIEGIISAFSVRYNANRVLQIYVLRGMLIYFVFASVVRILIPGYGHSAVIAFNVLCIYNLCRIAYSSFRFELHSVGLACVFLTLMASVIYAYQRVDPPTFPALKNATLELFSDQDLEGPSLGVRAETNGIGFVSIPILVDPGQKYRVFAAFRRGTAECGQLSIGSLETVGDLYTSGYLSHLTWEPYACDFTATWDIAFVNLAVVPSKAGQACFFGSLVVRNTTTAEIVLNLQNKQQGISWVRQ